MRFSTIFTAAAMAFSFVSAATQAETIVQTFKDVTTLSLNLRIETQKINLVNAPLQGYRIAQGFAGIIAKVSGASTMLSEPSMVKLGDADAQLVVVALTTFVRVHQDLLSVVIGKHGLLTLIPFFEPIRQALVSLEAVVDTFAFYLIALIPTQAPAANGQFGSLKITVGSAKDTYSTTL